MSETKLKLSPEKEAARLIIDDLRALCDCDLAPYWDQDDRELAHVIGLGGNRDTPSTFRLNADVQVLSRGGRTLSIVLHCRAFGEGLTVDAIKAQLGDGATGLLLMLQLLRPSEPWSGYGSLIELFESDKVSSEPNLQAEARTENGAETLHGSVGWTTQEENQRSSYIEVTHIYVGDWTPSRMVHLVSMLGFFRCEGGTTLLTELGTLIAEVKRTAEQKRAEAAQAAQDPAAETQLGEDVDETLPEDVASTAEAEQPPAQAEDPAPQVADPASAVDPIEPTEGEPSKVDRSVDPEKRVKGASPGKSKPKVGGLVGNAQSLLTKAVEASSWTPGSGQTLGGQIPKGMAASFTGKSPKDVKHEVNGEPVVFSFSWAMGGGILGFRKKAVTWSATQKS